MILRLDRVRVTLPPDYAPEEITEIAQKLREQAGLPKEPSGLVSEESADLVETLTGSTKR